MNAEDKNEFRVIVENLCGTFGRHATKGIIGGFEVALGDLQIEVIREGINRAIREGGDFPSAGSIRQRIIAEHDGHFDPERAWSWCPKSEGITQFVTTQMLRAWDVAQFDYDNGNQIGARIAFVAEYKRALDDARQNAEPARWFMSRGCGMREDEVRNAEICAISQAQSVGLLSAPFAQNLISEQRRMLGNDDENILRLADATIKRIGGER